MASVVACSITERSTIKAEILKGLLKIIKTVINYLRLVKNKISNIVTFCAFMKYFYFLREAPGKIVANND